MTEEFLLEDKKDIFPKKQEYPEGGGVNVFSWLTNAGTTIAPWWSKRRDEELMKFWRGNDHLSGAMYAMLGRMTSIPIRVEAKDKSIVSHVQQAEEYNKILLEETVSRSDPTQKGWPHVWGMFLLDHFAQDNGSFFVVDGPGRPDGPLTGRPTKLIHLDSFRVTRKANPEFPITYQDWDGKVYRFHCSRVIALSSMASPQYSMYGVGYCAVSRCVNYAQILLDMLVYKQEKLGSRPKERLIIGKKGVTAEDIAKAFMAVDEHANAQGLTRYGKTAVLAPNERSTASEIDIDVQDLVDAGQIFDEQTSITLGLYTIALAFGVPARWIWPATASGATKADAQFQHLAGMVQGPGEILRNLLLTLDAKFLPPQLVMVADYQDDEQDRQQAEIKKTRADQRKIDLEDKVYTLRVAREQALSDGDITQEQFNQMELNDGRLPSGDPLVSAFNTNDKQIQDLFVPVFLAAVGNPLDVDANDPIDMIIAIDEAALEATDATQNAPSAQQKRKARISLSALGELKTIYEQRATDETSAEVVAEFNMQAEAAQAEREQAEQAPTEEPPTEELPTEETEPELPEDEQETEVEEKAFNFSARAGEVIGGGLARDPEGRFISADQMGAAIRARLLEKIRGRKNEGKSNEENRAKVAAEIDLIEGGLDALATLGDGGIPDDLDVTDALVERGLAKVNPDGSVQISSQGASLLIAANSGNARRAQEAMIRAQAGKKPAKPGGGGGAAKPDKEQEQRENRGKVAQATEVNVEALNSFSEGAELDAESANQFAQDGLVEFDADGNPRLTSAGNSFVSASNRGDSGKARDVLSRAREAVQKKRDKVSELRSDADELSGDLGKVDEQLAQLDPIEDAEKITRLEQRKERLQERIDKANEQADEIESSLGTAVTEEKGLVAWVKNFFGLALSEKDARGDFQLEIRAAFRQLWAGQKARFGFVDEMVSVIQRGLTRAWHQGAKEQGINPDELTEDELNRLEDTINEQFPFLPALAQDILSVRNQAIEDGKTPGLRNMPRELFNRADLWVKRFDQTRILANAMAKLDNRKAWRLGDAEHCSSCLKLDGKVKRASFWVNSGILPRVADAFYLECRGFNCACTLQDTTERISRGPLPNLP